MLPGHVPRRLRREVIRCRKQSGGNGGGGCKEGEGEGEEKDMGAAATAAVDGGSGEAKREDILVTATVPSHVPSAVSRQTLGVCICFRVRIHLTAYPYGLPRDRLRSMMNIPI
jgi:hypothetical protein